MEEIKELKIKTKKEEYLWEATSGCASHSNPKVKVNNKKRLM